MTEIQSMSMTVPAYQPNPKVLHHLHLSVKGSGT